jgi:hypothetical protein
MNIQMESQKPKCGCIFGVYVCDLVAGHWGKHRVGGVSWTDAGAARVAKEEAAKAEKK